MQGRMSTSKLFIEPRAVKLLYLFGVSLVLGSALLAKTVVAQSAGANDAISGASPSNKCDCNLTGSLNNACLKPTGQCQCKNANIVGLKCDRCRENYHDFEAGCVECDKCYQIVQLGVEHHRKQLDELTDMINRIENDPKFINDENFEKQLFELLKRVQKMLDKAETAQGVENQLLAKFESLLAAIRRTKGITDSIGQRLKWTQPWISGATANVTIAEDLLRRILLEASNAEGHLNSVGLSALRDAQARADRMGKQSEEMAEMAKESRQLADQHEADAARMRELTMAAIGHTDLAYELAKNASVAQEANARNIAVLKQEIEKMVELLGKARKMVNDAWDKAMKSYDAALALFTLINSLAVDKADVPRIKQRAEDHLRSAQRLKTEVEEFITRHAQLLDSTQFKLNEMKALLAEARRQQQITDGQLADLDKTIQLAKEAVKKGDGTLKEAQDTLATLLKFDQKVQESQKEAMEALKKIPGIREMIKQAEDKTRDAASKLDSALADATQARDIAQQAFGLANETSSDVRRIRAEASELKSRISNLKTQAGELAENIKQTSGAMDKYEQLAKMDGELALQALERANQAASSARNASDTAKALLDILEPLLKAIDGIEGIDGNKLAQLEAELEKLKQKLAESNLSAIIEDLLAQRDKQKELMAYYQTLIDWLIKEVANIKAIRDSLPDKCFKRIRLEVPPDEN